MYRCKAITNYMHVMFDFTQLIIRESTIHIYPYWIVQESVRVQQCNGGFMHYMQTS